MKNSFENKNELSSLTHLHTHTHTHTHIYLYDKVFFALTAQKKTKTFRERKMKMEKKKKILETRNHFLEPSLFCVSKKQKKSFFWKFYFEKMGGGYLAFSLWDNLSKTKQNNVAFIFLTVFSIS